MRLAFLLLLFPCLSQAQSSLGLEANYMSGKLFRHTTKFTAPVPAYSQAAELSLVWQTNGAKAWQQRRRYPAWGLGMMLTDYGDRGVLGYAIAAYPHLEIPLIKGQRLEWTFRAGFGIAYLSRPYSRAPQWDTLNNAIGGHLNNFTLFATDLRYKISNRLEIQTGLNFSHSSNAAYQQPNLGLNMYGAHAGLRYFPDGRVKERPAATAPRLRNRFLAQARLGFAFNEMGTTAGPVYGAYLASLYASYRYHSDNKILLGTDYSYHNSIYAFLRNNEILPGEEKKHAWKGAVFAGHEWLFGSFGIIAQVGVYYHQAYLRRAPYYQKLGGQVYLLQNERGALKELFVYGTLKTHLTQAELAEFGVGVGL